MIVSEECCAQKTNGATHGKKKMRGGTVVVFSSGTLRKKSKYREESRHTISR